ncbi:hypothetical protein H2199_007808 [Coniosporium tulheliwenetii]|uniref:Uncharacterized protein n=1 Tax=Coniosporium tulheliwenetii TaxID=3383036 RepID=A0ACC2YP12_9PEZI|nr:hypothetical protein H2199_007808 [Cladosporium sp. JES 115]
MARSKGNRTQQDPAVADEVQAAEPVRKKPRAAKIVEYLCSICAHKKPSDSFPNAESTNIPPSCRGCLGVESYRICYACVSNWTSETAAKYAGRSPEDIACLACGDTWPYEYVKMHLSGNDIDRYEARLLRYALQDDLNLRWCPAGDCGAGYIHERNTDRCRKITCGNCGVASCYHCEIVWEARHDCKQHRDREMSPETLKSLQDQKARQCPHCKIAVIKIDGCSDMYCESCGETFDWGRAKLVGGGDESDT